MRFCQRLIVATLFILLTGLTAQAEIKVVVERNREADATPRFKFKNIPAPASNDAASKAKFTLVDGARDDESGDLQVVHDGKLPTEEDQPSRNFFFAQGEDGGRLAIDLGKVIEVKQVNTYSWHPNTRGPQVYKLYAADGSAPGFNAQPKKDADPAKVGWKLVAAVDTRPSGGEGGGQYGVSIFDSAREIGKYRYLLFDISATEKDDPFGNTFYSGINVISADQPGAPPAAAAPVARLISQSPKSAPQQITIEYTDAPELKDWVDKKLQPTVDTWYPKIIQALPSKDYTAPDHVSIVITNNYRGVAATGGTHVSCNAAWFKRNKDGEAAGAVVHELVHVVQQYRRVRRGMSNPGWLVEGIADYIRWFKYEPTPTGTRPRNPDRANYTDSYRITAGFLNFVVEKHDKEIVVNLNAAMRQGKYSAELWKQYTGKTADELWKEYAATLQESSNPEPSAKAREGWKLVWADEFDYTGVPDPAKWDYEVGYVRNNEAQYYTRARKENAWVEGGVLTITGRKEKFSIPSGRGSQGKTEADYTAASLITRGKASWTYGRIELRAKLPKGRGVWPAFWTLGTTGGWPRGGEIDIMEYVGKEPHDIHSNLHYSLGGRHTSSGGSVKLDDPWDTFHVYAMEWDSQRMDFFCDQTKYFTFDLSKADEKGSNPYRKPQYLLLNLALGGGYGGPIDDSNLPQKFVIDYVRVYQRAEAKK